MAKRENKTVLLWLAAAAIGVVVYMRKRAAASSLVPAVTPGNVTNRQQRVNGTTYAGAVAVDGEGNPSPGPGFYLEYGPDGVRRWTPVSAMN